MQRWLLPLLFVAIAQAQLPGTVHWSLSQTPGSKADERVLTLHGDVQKGWHVYGLTQGPGGPMPLVLKMEPGAPFQVSGAITGTVPEKHQDASFNLATEYFTGAFLLHVPVKQTGTVQDGGVPLAVRFQMCSDTTCMPPRTVHLVAKGKTAP